jgi:hypothetical protein
MAAWHSLKAYPAGMPGARRDFHAVVASLAMLHGLLSTGDALEA